MQNDREQQYSDAGRLEATIRKFMLDLSAEAMVDTILNDAMDFGGSKASGDEETNGRLRIIDDMTVVVVKVL
jgi:hypothetical protein